MQIVLNVSGTTENWSIWCWIQKWKYEDWFRGARIYQGFKFNEHWILEFGMHSYLAKLLQTWLKSTKQDTIKFHIVSWDKKGKI